MACLQGKLLVASSSLRDPNFERTVVLIVRHDEDGALGLVLNRPLEVTVQEGCGGEVDAQAFADTLLFQGGPCDGPLMCIHGHEGGSEVKVMRDVHFSASRERIEWVLRHGSPSDRVRFFAGYSGWTVGQIEMEIQEGAWVVAEGDRDRIFQRPRAAVHPRDDRGDPRPADRFAPDSGGSERELRLSSTLPRARCTHADLGEIARQL